MIIFHKKNTRFDLTVPLLDGDSPRLFNSGATVSLSAWSKDGTGAWTTLVIVDTFTEIGTSGVYEITLTASELDHDRVLIKYSGGTTQVDAAVVFNLSPNFASFTLGPTLSSIDVGSFIGDPTDLAIFKGEAKTFSLTILDSNGVAVDMSGKTLRFTVETIANPPVSEFDVTGGSITITGADNEIVNVAVTGLNSDLDAKKYQWRLWDTVADKVFQHGLFEVVDTSETTT